MPNTATKEEVFKDLDKMSDRVSFITRTTAVGILVIGWGFIVTPNTKIQVWSGAVLAAIALAFIALLFDWAQYLAGFLNSRRTWAEMERDSSLRGFNPGWLYDLRGSLFFLKQLATFGGVLVLVSAIVPAIVRLVGQ